MNHEIPSMSVRARPLFEVLADSLRERIHAHEISPGESLDEYRIASCYGVSRGAVRDALCILAGSGMVQPGSGGRFHVVCSSTQDVSRLFDVLELLEGFAVRQAADARRAPDEGCLFWPGLCAASGNHYLTNQIDGVLTHLKLAFGPLFTSPDMQPSKALQDKLRKLILEGRADQAEQVLSEYWQQRRQIGLTMLPAIPVQRHTSGAGMAEDDAFPVFAI